MLLNVISFFVHFNPLDTSLFTFPSLTLAHCSWTIKIYNTLYVKCEMKYTAFCVEENGDLRPVSKKSVNIFVD